MDVLPTLALHLAIATVVGLCANRVAAALVQSVQIISGFPRWRWVLSMATQGVVFPAMMTMAWQEGHAKGLGLEAWAVRSAAQLGQWERVYVLALFASQSRDMFPMPAAADFMMRLHHWVVMVACVSAFFTPAGFGLFIAGTFVLELGSMTFNLRTLYPDSAAAVPVYHVCMLASNVAALYGGYYMVTQIDAIPAPIKGAFALADLGVCLGRQRHALKDAGLIGSGHAKAH